MLFPGHDIGDRMSRLYSPCIESGSRFPHLWLRRKDSSREVISSLDLVREGAYTVISCADSASPLDSVRVDDFVPTDPADAALWETLWGAPEERITVRPDGHIV